MDWQSTEREGIRRLSRKGIQTVAVAGNHDHDVLQALSDQLPSDFFKLLGQNGKWERFSFKLQSGEVHGIEEKIDIPAVLMQLKEQTEELSQGSHEFFFDIQPDLRLSGITANLESAFSNLIANAVKYTPDGGKIQVRWGDSPDGPQLTVRD